MNFRHCVAGDQWPDPANPLRIAQSLLLQLARATRHLRAAWSFTHFPMGPANQATLKLAAAKGLVVNASTESRSRAAALVRQGIPAVCVVAPDAPAVFHHEGVRFVACSASRSGRKVPCSSCGGSLQLRAAGSVGRGIHLSRHSVQQGGPMVVRHPLREALTIHCAARNGQHGGLGGVDTRGQLHPIQHQGDLQRGVSDALVPVHKGVVLDEREAERSGLAISPG